VAERTAQRVVLLAFGPRRRGHLPERCGVLSEVHGHAVRSGTDPDHLAAGRQRIEMLGEKARDASRQHLGLPELDRQCQSLERYERFAKRSAPVDAVPPGKEAGKCVLLDRLDLAPKRGERRPAEPPQHVRIAPLALAAARPKLTADEQLVTLERGEQIGHVAAEPGDGLSARERAASFRVAQHELAQRLRSAFEERVRKAGRRHGAEPVPVPARVLGRDQPVLAGEADDDGTPVGEQRCRERRFVLAGSQVAAHAQLVVQLVGRLGIAAQLPLDLLHGVGIEEVAKLLLAEQLAQQIAVEGERLGAPFGGRRVVLVHVRRDVVEQERRRVGRRALRLDLDDVELTCLHRLEERAERGQVEDVLQALAIRLEDDREAAVLARDLQQRLRLETLLPQRCALARAPPRDEQRPAGVLAETGAEERGVPHLGDDEILDVAGVDLQVVERRRRVRLGEVQGDPVVRPDRLGLDAVRLPQAGRDRHRPRRVHTSAERSQDADPPVSDLVAEPLDHDGAVAWNSAGRVVLLADELQQIVGRPLLEVVLVAQPRPRLRLRQAAELTRGGADLLAELVWTADALALPERDRTRHARRRRDQHAIARDLLDAPRRGSEQERLAGARLVDHLLVELADPASAVDEEDAEEPAVGDRSGVRDGEPARAVARADDAAGAVPDDARPQLGELVRRVTAREHVEHVLELRAREVAERVGTRDERVQVVDPDLLAGGDRDDLLREHVERVARDHRLLDLPAAHRARDDRRLEQVGAELREYAPLRDGAELVARPSDPLQAAGDGLRRLDLHNEIDCAHVDAELEARRRDQARDAARFQILFDEHTLLAGERTVMCARDLPLGKLVQAQRQPLGETAVVDEHDGRPMRLDEPQDLRVDRRPDRAGAVLGADVHLLAVRRDRMRQRRRRAQLAQVLNRHDHLEVELLARPRVDELDLTPAGHEAADLLERPLRRRKPDPLDRVLGQRLQALDADRHVRAPLRARNGVYLVQDQGLDARQHLVGLRGQHQKQRLGRRDQDVGRLLQELTAFALRGVARPHGDSHVRLDSREGPAQVPLDVVVQGLERRDVEDAQAVARRGAQPVQGVEKRRQRLARARRGLDHHMPAGCDRRPAELLRRRRRVERLLEPAPRRR
jgi:hypothetical protein